MPVILDNKNPSFPSVFRPTALLREARRQKTLPTVDVPAVCILDPDGDIVRRLRKDNRSQPFDGWPCYHTWLGLYDAPGEWPWTYMFLVVLQVIYLIDPPGRSLGVDALVWRREATSRDALPVLSLVA